jgi:crossover junction endodeoxyribonuclease RuvC
MKVLGVDPGVRATGYGVVEGQGGELRLVECGIVRPSARSSLAERLAEIHQGLLEVLERHPPACVAVEDVFYGRNARTAAVLGHARGVILMTAASRSVQVAEYPAAEIKKAVTGHGSATKTQVAYMVQKLLSLAEPPTPADAADGCAAAICHFLHGVGPVAEARARL